MESSEINELLAFLDGRGSDEEYKAIERLKDFEVNLPEVLLNKYNNSKKWGERASCLYHSIKYAKNNENSYQLGIKALNDKSKVVRYRACMLLAVAQKKEAIPFLEELLENNDSQSDAIAAIDAIKNNNQNYFVDREHSGKVKLNV